MYRSFGKDWQRADAHLEFLRKVVMHWLLQAGRSQTSSGSPACMPADELVAHNGSNLQATSQELVGIVDPPGSVYL